MTQSLILIRNIYQTALIQQQLHWYHTINKKSGITNDITMGTQISKLQYISVNNGK